MSEEAKQIVEEGVELYKKGEKEEAFQKFNKALELDPKNIRALNNRAWMFFEQKKYNKAIADYERSLALDDTNFQTHHNLANVYFALEKYDQALKGYERVLELKPDYAWAFENIGVIYYKRLEMEKALEYFYEALRNDQSEGQFFHNRGGALMYLKQYNKALCDFEDALKLNPQNSWAHTNIGIIYSEQEKLEAALEHLDKAIELDPNNNVFYKTRSDVKAKMGKFDDAHQDYEMAKKLGYDFPKTGFFHKKILPHIKYTVKNYWLTLTFISAYILTFIIVFAVNGGYENYFLQTNAEVVNSGVWHIFTGVFYSYGSSFLEDISFLSPIPGLNVYSGLIVLFTFLWCLFIYGRRTEYFYPKWVFPLAYFGFGFLGNAMFYLLSPNKTFCLSNLSAIWGFAGWILVDNIIRMIGKGEGFEAIGSFLEFVEANVGFFVGTVMAGISSALSQNGWHFFIGTGITFGLGLFLGLFTGLLAIKKKKKK